MSEKNYEPTYEGQLDKCQDERHALQMQLEEYIEAFEFERKEFHEALDDLAKMKAERDEARREICINAANELSYELGGRIILARDEAKNRGWDCFKDAPAVKTLKGIVVSKGKAIPPKFDIEENDNV